MVIYLLDIYSLDKGGVLGQKHRRNKGSLKEKFSLPTKGTVLVTDHLCHPQKRQEIKLST